MEPCAHAPYGLLQLSAVVDQLGYKIAVLDNNAFRLPIDALRQEIKGDVQPKTIRIGIQPSSPMFGQMAPKEFGTKDDVLEITILPDGAITAPSAKLLVALESGALSKESVEALRQEVKNFQLSASEGWDVIGIGGLTTQYKYIREIAKVCKTEFPAAVLVGGGGFATAQPHDMMRWIPEFDCLCLGEGIITFKEILEHVEDQNWKTVKGLAYREGSKIKLSAMRPLIEEFYHCEEDCNSDHLTFEKALAKDFACQCGAKLANNLDEEIPFPAYEYGAVETYLMNSRIPYSVESMRPDCRRMDVLSSYGCPMRCSFCFHCGSTPYCQSKIYGKTVSGKPFRQHSPRYVVELIDHLRRHYLINFVSFIDENFTVNKLWYDRFCSELENFDLATLIHWGILSHVKTINQKMLERGHDLGLSYVSYGGESANERLLKECHKGQTKTDMESAITATQAANVNTIMTFILGLPNETIDDVIETAQFFVDNQIHCVPFFCFPPGTSVVANPSICNIEDISEGSKVLSHRAIHQPVVHLIKHDYTGELVNIKAYDVPVSMTPTHPVYAIERHRRSVDKRDNIDYPDATVIETIKHEKAAWVSAEKLERGDIVLYPIDRVVKDVSEVHLPWKSKHFKHFKKTIPCSAELLRLIGYYLAEGSFAYRSGRGEKHALTGIQLSFNSNETDYIADVEHICHQLLNYNPRQYKLQATHTTMTCIFNRPFARWVKQEFGEYARNKTLPFWIMSLPLKKQKELIRGYWRGDGHTDKLGFALTSVNLRLLRQIKHLLLRFDIVASISKTRTWYRLRVQSSFLPKMQALLGITHPYISERRYTVARAVIDGDYAYIPIKHVWKSHYSGPVYNMEVDVDNSYVVAGLGAVHNCQPYPATELYEKYKDKIIEQHMTEEEKEFLREPNLNTLTKLDLWKQKSELPSKSQLMRELPVIKEKIKDAALERWVLELDDATKLSANLTDFNDVELAGLQYMLARWEIDRLKQFKKLIETRTSIVGNVGTAL